MMRGREESSAICSGSRLKFVQIGAIREAARRRFGTGCHGFEVRGSPERQDRFGHT